MVNSAITVQTINAGEVLGYVTVIVVLVMIINLIVDVSYAFLDPRIRFGAPKSEQ